MTAVFSFSARASFNESNELREYQVEVITFFLRCATKALRDNDGIMKANGLCPRSRLLALVSYAGAQPKDRLQIVYVEAENTPLAYGLFALKARFSSLLCLYRGNKHLNSINHNRRL